MRVIYKDGGIADIPAEQAQQLIRDHKAVAYTRATRKEKEMVKKSSSKTRKISKPKKKAFGGAPKHKALLTPKKIKGFSEEL